MGVVRETPDGVPVAISATEVHIDPSTLNAFASSLAAEFRSAVEPVSSRVQNVFANGAQIGATSPSRDLAAAVLTHLDCRASMIEQLAAYATASAELVAAAQLIIARYGASDATAQASVSSVLAAIEAAQQRLDPPPTPGTLTRAYE
jgi:hypothetical protein